MSILRKATMIVIFVCALLCFGIYARGNEDIIVPNTEPEIPEELLDATEKEDPQNSSLVINKELISGVWHVGCDVMGNQAWVKDEISNPQGIPSREGHRLAYCGDPSHWIIYLDESGKPYMMDEIKSGSTGGTLHTKFYTDSTFTQEMPISQIGCGERIYWTTWNRDQVWHHTGITTPETPEFDFVIEGVEYKIEAGSFLELHDLHAGVYQIIEKYDPQYFIANVSIPFVVNEEMDVVANVTVGRHDEAIVTFTNQRITPEPPPQTEVPPPPQTETQQSETQSETELITEVITESESETEPLITESETEPLITESETKPPIIESETKMSESETQRPESELPTEKESIVITEKQTEFASESESRQEFTEAITQSVSELITEHTIETEGQKQTETTTQPESTNPPRILRPTRTYNPFDPPLDTQQLLPQETLPATTQGVLGAQRNKNTDTKEKERKLQDVQGNTREVQQVIPATELYTPKTGDDSPLLRLLIALSISAAVIAAIVAVVINKSKF